jgi:hypothetical protein
MSTYRHIERNIWSDERIRPLSRNAKLLWVYLFANPQDHYTGIYSLSVAMASDYLGITTGAVVEALAELHGAGLIGWDGTARVVFVRGMFRHQCSAKPGNKFANGAVRWLKSLPKSPLVDAFKAKYAGDLGIEAPPAYPTDTQPIPNEVPIDRVLSVSVSVSDSVSDSEKQARAKCDEVIDRVNERRAYIAERFGLPKRKGFAKTDTQRKFIAARLGEGEELETLLAVVDARARKIVREGGEGFEHLTTSTPFRPSNWAYSLGLIDEHPRKTDTPAANEPPITDESEALAHLAAHGEPPRGWAFGDSRDEVRRL